MKKDLWKCHGGIGAKHANIIRQLENACSGQSHKTEWKNFHKHQEVDQFVKGFFYLDIISLL